MKNLHKFTLISFLGYSGIILAILILFANIDQLLYEPKTTPAYMFQAYPSLFIKTHWGIFIWMRPGSTIIVYLLGILGIIVGIKFIQRSISELSRYWWGIALLLWGLGAIVAGTSYQAFSYEIKCRNYTFCLWTSLWEIFYLILSIASINAMLISHVNANIDKKKNRTMFYYYIIFNMSVSTICILIGAIEPIKFLISFEFMILSALPAILFMFGHNVYRFLKYHLQKNLISIQVWFLLGIVMLFYFAYLQLGIMNFFFEQKFCFSANDVLHTGLIFWMIFMDKRLLNVLHDNDKQKYVIK
ncbi:MAG: hypothetical protein ACTSWL_03040 [Promethearchaeota archaeon]